MTLSTRNSSDPQKNKSLSVQVSLAGLSFFVRSSTGEIYYFSHEPLPEGSGPPDVLLALKREIEKAKVDISTLGSVKVIHAVNEYTAVPSHLFDSRKASDFLKFNTRILSNDFIAWDEIEAFKIHMVYIPLVNINNFLFDTFGTFDYYHSSTVWLRMIKNIDDGKKTRAYVHIKERHYSLLIINGNRLLLLNNYPYSTPEDYLYYLLFSFEQLGLNPEETEVVLMGQVSRDDELFEISYRYIRHVGLYRDIVDNSTQNDDVPLDHILLKHFD